MESLEQKSPNPLRPNFASIPFMAPSGTALGSVLVIKGENMNQKLQSLRTELEKGKGITAIESALIRFANGLGYSSCQLAWLRQPSSAPGVIERPSLIGNIPAEWIERYWQHRYYDDDCIARTCLQSVLPVVWTCTPVDPLTNRQRRIAREAACFGLAYGVAIAVRGPRSLLTVLTVARYREIAHEDISRTLDTLSLGAIHLNAAIIVQLQPERIEDTTSALKPAECSCILWAARGKSTIEIGELLGMPERTVYFHIGNAMDKLGVSTRIQAVAVAIKAGLIAP